MVISLNHAFSEVRALLRAAETANSGRILIPDSSIEQALITKPVCSTLIFIIGTYIDRMDAQSPILQYLLTAYQQQTPVMSNSSAYVSRLAITTDEPLLFEVDLAMGANQTRTYAIQRLSNGQTDNPVYQVAPVHNGAVGSFSKLSESDLYYMFTGKSLTDDE